MKGWQQFLSKEVYLNFQINKLLLVSYCCQRKVYKINGRRIMMLPWFPNECKWREDSLIFVRILVV